MHKLIHDMGRNFVLISLITLFPQLGFILTPACVVAEPGPNGIDFWANDRLHLPDYGASTNLILNPSFEAGLRYWGYLCYGQSIISLEYSNFETIDSNEAHSGSHSLRLKALSVRDPLGPGVFTIPVIPDVNYVLSFYAKGSRATSLKLNVWARGLNTYFLPGSLLAFSVNNQWQRFTIPINQAERFIAIYFDAQLTSGSQEGYIWVDDVQLELGSVATAFTQAPVAAQLVSAARGNFLEFGQAPNFNLILQTQPDVTGTVAAFCGGFLFQQRFHGNVPIYRRPDGKKYDRS